MPRSPSEPPRPEVPEIAQSPLQVRSHRVWPVDQRCAVSLCYDDGLTCHTAWTAPLLSSLGLCATFYVPIGDLSTLQTDPESWRRIAAAGHELGNHSVFHPCRKDDLKFWLDDRYDLRRYTLEQWGQELDLASFALSLIDGRPTTDRTFGNTCCELTVGEGDDEESMEPMLRTRFAAGRGTWDDKLHYLDSDIARWQLGHWSGDGKSADQLIAEVEHARRQNAWLIYMFHGVGERTHPLLWVDQDEHETFIRWLAAETDIWVAPMREVATWMFASE